MARLVLHIGTHKTGTTMVQDRLYAVRKDLARQGFIYPTLGRHTGHHGYLTDWIALPAAYQNRRGGIAGLRDLATRWRDSDATLFLSSEEFSRAGGRGGQVAWTMIREVFQGFELRVICTLRSQWRFMQSVYLEIAKGCPPPVPPRLFHDALTTGLIDGLWCDYLALYEHLVCHFDPEDLRLIDYDTACGSEVGLLGQILRHAAPQVTLPSATLAEVRPNASLPAIPVWAAHVVAGGPSPDASIRRAAREAFDLEWGDGRPGCLFTRSEIAQLQAHFAPLNDRLANRVRRIQPGWHLSQGQPPDDTLFREDIGPEYWIRLARRLAMQGHRHAA